jgi:DNA polymerase
MSQFNTALQFVHEKLTEMQENGGKLRASKASLERLAATKTVTEKTVVAEPKNLASALSRPAPQSGGGEKAARMAALRERALVCVKCPNLAESRTQVVFGVGNIDAEVMFVGEAPGADEDLQGEPFVGRAGQLLTKIIEAMGFSRDTVYIGNVLKCRPDMPAGEPGNRKPRPDEMATCLPYLIEQIEIIQPRVMVALGATAMEGLLSTKEPMNKLRGHWHEFKGIPLMATYHPAYLLRNQSNTEKRKVWEDMLLVLEKLGKPISEKQRGYFLSKG